MLIHLLRHGIAAPLGEENHFRDEERALTPEGSMKMRKSAQGLKRLGLTFDLIASSPLVRALQTAEIVAETFKFRKTIELWEELEPDGSIEAVFTRLSGETEKASVLLVGHQPSMGYLASCLILGDTKASLPIKKGGIYCIQIDQIPPRDVGELCWMLPPKILREIAEL